MNQSSFYEALTTPFFAPPAYIFPIAWSILYPIIFTTYGYVFYKFFQKEFSFWIILPFIHNLISNFLFTYLFFTKQNFTLALIDILVVLITIIWSMIVIYPYHKFVTFLQIPYLLWVSFATVLQIYITLKN